MSNTPNKGLPLVPTGTIDPAAGTNDALNVMDAIDSVTRVQSIAESVPPAGSDLFDGALYIVAAGGSGDWSGKDNMLARYVEEGDFWQFYEPGSQVAVVLNAADGGLYKFVDDSSDGGWTLAAGIDDAPSDGTVYGRKDGAWQPAGSISVMDSSSSDPTTVDPCTALVFTGDVEVTDLGGGMAQVDITGGGAAARDTVTAVTNSAGTVTLDASLGDYFTHLMTANVTTLAFSNLPGAGKGATLMLRITQDSTPRTFAWPASFKWAGGVAGVISTGSGAVDLLAITSFDNGTTWRATLAKAFA